MDQVLYSKKIRFDPCLFTIFLYHVFNIIILNCNKLQVGDAGPIYDIMAGTLENISPVTAGARTALSAVYRTAQIIAPLPNMSYQNKAKPRIISIYYVFISLRCLSLSKLTSHKNLILVRHSLMPCFTSY